MRFIKFLTTIGLLISAVISCYYDNEEYLFPEMNTTCDTTQITYTTSVAPILQQSCLSCHSNAKAGNFGGNIRLEMWEDVKVRADNGSLSGSVSHQGGFSPMPKGAQKLDDCSITLIQKWIEAGSPNN